MKTILWVRHDPALTERVARWTAAVVAVAFAFMLFGFGVAIMIGAPWVTALRAGFGLWLVAACSMIVWATAALAKWLGERDNREGAR